MTRALVFFLQLAGCNVPFFLTTMTLETVDAKSKRRDDVLLSLDVIIQGLNLAETVSSITPAKVVFSTVKVIVEMIKASFLLCEG